MKKKICRELRKTLKNKLFFNCVGGCGVDLSGGKSNCMADDGIWFRFCPFCGKEIVCEKINFSWKWYEKE